MSLVLRSSGSGERHSLADFSVCAGPDLNQANPRRLRTLPALDHIDDGLPFTDRGEPGSFKSRDVDEYVLAASIRRDEARRTPYRR